MADKKVAKKGKLVKTNSSQRTLFDHFKAKSTPTSNDKLSSTEAPRGDAPIEHPDAIVIDLSPSLNTQPLPPAVNETGTHQDYIDLSLNTPSGSNSVPHISTIEITDSEDAESPVLVPRSISRPFPAAPIPNQTSGASRHDPIVVEERTVLKAPGPRTKQAAKDKPVYSIFEKAKSQTQTPSSPSRRSIKTSDVGLSPPWPSKVWQHNRGPQNSYSSTSSSISRRAPRTSTAPNGAPSSNSSDWSRVLRVPALESINRHNTTVICTANSVRASIPPSHIWENAAIRHALNTKTHTSAATNPTQRAWVDKWRPKTAIEVLGNHDNALYLREWLRALALQYHDIPSSDQPPAGRRPGKGKRPTNAFDERPAKRPRVVRQVERKRGRKRRVVDSEDEDEWIVYSTDDTEELGTITDDDDTDDFCRRTPPQKIPQYVFTASKPALNPPSDADSSSSALIGVDANDRLNSFNAPTTFDQLTNTILLTGPSGSGKTAAVYACAEELGWEVFEVYPGIGKRGGSNLLDLVGEVGKNHLVRDSKRKSDAVVPSRLGSANFFGSREKAVTPRVGSKSSPSPRTSDEKDAAEPLDDSHQRGAYSVKESIILLEEIDIVFKEDVAFWPTIINLIKDCRRPVVLTCNDLSLVPLEDLPLQMILHFQACAEHETVSYLQSIALAEGFNLERASLYGLLRESAELISLDVPDEPLHPSTTELPSADLRQVVQSLQLYCCGGPTLQNSRYRGSSDIDDLADWTACFGAGMSEDSTSSIVLYRIGKHSEAVSFMDSNILRNTLDAPESLASLYGSEWPADVEIGHTYLCPSALEEVAEQDAAASSKESTSASNVAALAGPKEHTLAYHWRDVDMAEEAMRVSRGRLASLATTPTTPYIRSTNGGFDSRALFRSRVAYQRQILEIVRHSALIPPSGPLLPQPAAFLEYIPWIWLMVRSDDEQERASTDAVVSRAADGTGQPKRMTRNSLRREYVRQISLSEQQLVMVRATGLGWEGG